MQCFAGDEDGRAMGFSLLALQVHRELCRKQEVVDLYTDRGGCEGCGECCSRFLPMSRFDVSRLRSYVERHHVVLHEPKGDVDLTCPLLSEDGMCMAYDARPDICRLYRCDEHVRGIFRMPVFAGSMDLVDVRDVLKGCGV